MLTTALMATPAAASAVYDFSGNFLNSNFAAPDASFEVVSPTVISSTETFSAAASSLVCGDAFVTCTGVTFTPGLDGHDAIQINYDDSGNAQSVFYYFLDGSFAADGVYSQNAGDFYSNGTLTVSDISPTPLPATFGLMLLGVGALGFLGWCRGRQAAAVGV